MKTINIKNKIQSFYDYETNKCTGFVGKIKLYNDEIYIDTRDGTGYDEMFQKLKRMINYLAYRYNIPGNTVEDTKQDIAVYILEGLPKFNPNKKTKLSTFLQMLINRRLINELRYNGRMIRNSTILNTTLYKVICKCSNNFTIVVDNNDTLEEIKCENCNESIENVKLYVINKEPISINGYYNQDKKQKLTLNDVVSENSFDIPMVYGKKSQLEELVIHNHDLKKLFEKIDPKVQKLISLVCFQGYSVSKAANSIGLSHMGASNKLKKLKKNKLIKEILNR